MTEEYIREIKSVQPDGPYTICGMCFGGWIAFEMARQLTTAGEEVGRLIIFDSGGPRRAKSPPGKASKWFWKNPRLVNIVHSLSRMALDGESKRIKKAAQHHRFLKRNYVPETYEGGILFLRSEEFDKDQKLRRHIGYWNEVCKQGVESHLVPGGHGNILQAPQVFEAARIVKGAMNS